MKSLLSPMAILLCSTEEKIVDLSLSFLVSLETMKFYTCVPWRLCRSGALELGVPLGNTSQFYLWTCHLLRQRQHMTRGRDPWAVTLFKGQQLQNTPLPP